MSKPEFREEQHFRTNLFFVVAAFFVFLLIFKFFKMTQQPMPYDMARFVVSVFVVAAFITYIWSLKLRTRITERYIRFQYFPWHYKKHRIKWRDVSAYKVMGNCSSGKNNRWNIIYGDEVYSFSGKCGIRLFLKNGKQVFLGSRKALELHLFLKKVRPKARELTNNAAFDTKDTTFKKQVQAHIKNKKKGMHSHAKAS